MINLSSEIFPYKSFDLKSSINLIKGDFSVPNIIIGKQAEAIFEHIILSSSYYKLLVANTQIQSNNITIGELDYLLENIEAKEYIHVEVACKFYLFDDSIKNDFAGKWIGPNRKDTLLDKINKLQTKQFPLLHQPEAAPLLNTFNLKASQFKQQHCILTSLYIPLNLKIDTLPNEYQACVVGTYVHYKNLKLSVNSTYALPDKKQWLAPSNQIKNWINHKEAMHVIARSIEHNKAIQVYEKSNNKVTKFFVVWW